MDTYTHSHILSCKLCFQDRVSDFQQCYLRLWLSMTSCQIAFQLQVFTAHVYHSSDIHIVITLDPSRATVTKIERVCPGCMQEDAYCIRLSICVCQIRILPFCASLADSETCNSHAANKPIKTINWLAKYTACFLSETYCGQTIVGWQPHHVVSCVLPRVSRCLIRNKQQRQWSFHLGAAFPVASHC